MKIVRKICLTTQRLAHWLIIALSSTLIVCCVFLDSVDQASSVQAGEVFEATLTAHVNAAQERSNVRFVIGILLPRSWRAAANTKMTYTSDFGSGELVQIPSSVRAPNSGNNLAWSPALMNKFGIGPNLIDDMEWVVFWTREQYNIVNGDQVEIDAKISIRTGEQNMRFKVGYFVGSSEDGLNDFLGGPGALYKSMFSSCFEVTDGEGDIIDFCNPPQTFLTPFRSSDNDILTLTFDREILPGPLGDDIFLCATAELADGTFKEVCQQDAHSRLTLLTGTRGRFEITFWPRQHFALTAGESIIRLTYYFTDASGAIKVGYANSPDEPFTHTFRCD
ncbi:DUF4961 domain-containing protein [Sphingobacterium griseoflavum]|uniref:DUF4961 domain-containing protein n=1 Tax=Sphingobacterium griseoflavum TaxID=1474952 RepID=A0ABQ3HUF1_9SPHI|nr:DUF4961 domain-containing protein [Sphingobacterium griseoflavum]GHE35722.1 hypothetical protein GCM10017764_18780 [Sphingobacterium griseoflavum]